MPLLKIMKLKSQILVWILMLAGCLTGSSAGVTAKATLDSVYILMGKQTALHIEVVGELAPDGALSVIDSMWNKIEIVDFGKPEITDLGNNRKELKQDIIIQSFDSGMYAVPPVFFISSRDTVATDNPVLKVLPVPVDTLVTIHDYADVSDVDRKLFDYLPDWATDYGLWILLALIVIGGAAFVYFKWLRQGKLPLMPKRKPVPPYNLAMQQLKHLDAEKLCERGEEKQFYTRLTDILRVYLNGRFGINAMEMTSTQIMNALRSNDETRNSERMMQQILEIADFVKFAKVRPLPEDNKLAMSSALSFVEDTKPVAIENPEEKSGAEETGKTPKKD